MTFVISAFQMYVLHFGHFFENRKNSGLTPGRTVDFSQYNYVSMHVLNICVRVCGLFVRQNYKSVSVFLLFNLDN